MEGLGLLSVCAVYGFQKRRDGFLVGNLIVGMIHTWTLEATTLFVVLVLLRSLHCFGGNTIRKSHQKIALIMMMCNDG